MSYLYLFLAIVAEVCGTTLMKLSNGLANIKYALLMLVFYVLSLVMLTLALKKIPIGVAYAIWSGIGIILLLTIGVIFFKETITASKLIFMSLILAGTIGLNLAR